MHLITQKVVKKERLIKDWEKTGICYNNPPIILYGVVRRNFSAYSCGSTNLGGKWQKTVSTK